MPTCPRCGKVNIKDAQFCQECGYRLAPAPAAAPAPVANDRPVCADCGAVNDPGMRFCKMCGKPFARAQAAPTPAPAVEKSAPAVEKKPAAAAPLTCPSCHQTTPAGMPFCQHCGTKLAASQPAAAPAAKPEIKPIITARPEAATMRAEVAKPEIAKPEPAKPEPAKPDAVQARSDAAITMRGQASGGQKVTMAPIASATRSEPRLPVAWGRIVAIHDGADAEAHALVGEAFDIGRSEGQLQIAADPYLGPRHVRITSSGGAVKVRALDATNGVFVKLREGHELAPGDLLLVGRQLLRFETLAPEERDPPPLVELGVRLIGSHVRETWGRLRQITAAGTTRDVHHLTRNEVVLGRNEGDIHFPDDEHVAPRHAILRRAGARARIEDTGTPAGTFVRLRGDRELRAGDVLRFGDQTFRFETL